MTPTPFQSLLARVGLRDEQLVDVDAELRGVRRVHRVLGVDVGGDVARLLRLGHDVERERRLARRLGAEDLDDATARDAADADGRVERERGRRDGRDVDHLFVAEAHDRTLAEFLFDVRERRLDRLAAVGALPVSHVCYHFFLVPFSHAVKGVS